MWYFVVHSCGLLVLVVAVVSFACVDCCDAQVAGFCLDALWFVCLFWFVGCVCVVLFCFAISAALCVFFFWFAGC